MKITTVGPANIAFIKYWGRADHKLFIPRNNNISMTIGGCKTIVTAQLDETLSEDLVEVKFFEKEYEILQKNTTKARNLYDQIERIRNLSGIKTKIRIKSENNFPSDAGIAASASSFSTQTAAILLAYGLDEKFNDKVEFSRQVRLCGSSSAVRSVYGGFVELLAGKTHENSYSVQIADEKHWDLVDIVAVVDPLKKKFTSSEGHELADSSPYFEVRIAEMQNRIDGVREAILEKNIRKLGPLVEEESTSMHAVMMTSKPAIYYWGAGTMSVMQSLMKWREEDDLQAYFTIDAGPNVHVICEKKDANEVQRRLNANEFVNWTIYNEACEGVNVSQEHLF